MDAIPSFESVLLSTRGAIATVTLNEPERRNPLSPAMIAELAQGLAWCRRADSVRVVVLTGAGRAFCAGADLAAFHGAGPAGDGELVRHQERRGLADLFSAIRGLGKPVIGRVNGHALAGGFGLACACDLIVALESASFGTPEINVGVWPMMISTILARNLPRKQVLEMMLLGDRWTAAQLREAGLVNRVAATVEELDTITDELAGRIAEKSPAVLRLGRDAFYAAEDMSFAQALEYLLGQLTMVTLAEDSREGVAAFLEKRKPEFTGR